MYQKLFYCLLFIVSGVVSGQELMTYKGSKPYSATPTWNFISENYALTGITKVQIAKTEKGATGEISAEQEIKILQKLFNQRKESIEIFTKENRPELAVKEKEEMDIITTYLPAQMSDDELKNIVQATIAETGATSIKDMGKVIGSVSKKVAGKAEGSRISSLVKELLGA